MSGFIVYTYWDGEQTQAFTNLSNALRSARAFANQSGWEIEVEKNLTVTLTKQNFVGMFGEGGTLTNWCEMSEIIETVYPSEGWRQDE